MILSSLQDFTASSLDNADLEDYTQEKVRTEGENTMVNKGLAFLMGFLCLAVARPAAYALTPLLKAGDAPGGPACYDNPPQENDRRYCAPLQRPAGPEANQHRCMQCRWELPTGPNRRPRCRCDAHSLRVDADPRCCHGKGGGPPPDIPDDPRRKIPKKNPPIMKVPGGPDKPWHRRGEKTVPTGPGQPAPGQPGQQQQGGAGPSSAHVHDECSYGQTASDGCPCTGPSPH